MRRRKQRSAFTIYRERRGDGWILTHSSADADTHRAEIVLYHIGPHGPRVETREVPIRSVDSLLRRECGAILAPYEGARPEPQTAFEDQPRAVRMQRHGYDIYQALGHVRGISETRAVAAAQTFGSTWRDKSADEWAERVSGIGSGRAENLRAALD